MHPQLWVHFLVGTGLLDSPITKRHLGEGPSRTPVPTNGHLERVQ